MATKKTKTNPNKGLIFNFTKCVSATDPYQIVAITKFKNLKDWECMVICTKLTADYFTKLADYIDGEYVDQELNNINTKFTNTAKVTTKPNVFKRFWNWIKRKK